MTEEQENHMVGNIMEFKRKYLGKYRNGQIEHGGNMYEMGAYQALNNMKDEVLDMWSYCRQIELTINQINEAKSLEEVQNILHREKPDDEQRV